MVYVIVYNAWLEKFYTVECDQAIKMVQFLNIIKFHLRKLDKSFKLIMTQPLSFLTRFQEELTNKRKEVLPIRQGEKE